MSVTTLVPTSKVKEPVTAVGNAHPMFDAMEEMHGRAFPYMEQVSRSNGDSGGAALLQPFPKKLAADTVKLANELSDRPVSHKSFIRTLYDLLARIAQATERHIFAKKWRAHEKENETKDKVAHIASLTRKQGGIFACSGIGSPVLQLLASTVVGGQFADVIKGLANLIPHAAQALNNFVDSWKQGDEFDKSLYIQLAASDRQALEGLKNMARELQQKLLQLLQQEQRAIQDTMRP